MSDAVVAWIAGVAAIIVAAAGLAVAVREVRRKARRDCLADVNELERWAHELETELIAWHAYSYAMRVLLADHGIDVPDPPPRDADGLGVLRDGPDPGGYFDRIRRPGRQRRDDRPHDDDGGGVVRRQPQRRLTLYLPPDPPDLLDPSERWAPLDPPDPRGWQAYPVRPVPTGNPVRRAWRALRERLGG